MQKQQLGHSDQRMTSIVFILLYCLMSCNLASRLRLQFGQCCPPPPAIMKLWLMPGQVTIRYIKVFLSFTLLLNIWASYDPGETLFNERWAMGFVLIWVSDIPRSALWVKGPDYLSWFVFMGGLVLWWESAVQWTLLMTQGLKLNQMTGMSWLHVQFKKKFP